MSEIKFRSDIKVSVNTEACCGSDRTLARAAWAVPPNEGHDRQMTGVLAGCMKLHHNSPFEHGLLSVYVEAPGVVWWQLTRQRFMSMDSEDFAFSLESGRYKVLDPEFYLPPYGRPMFEPAGFKPMKPELSPGRPEDSHLVTFAMKTGATLAWERYENLVKLGVARELARNVLPNWMLYCDGYVTAKPLSWLHFFMKRNPTPDTTVATYPQWEIAEFARQCEEIFATQFPLTHEAFIASGRIAP